MRWGRPTKGVEAVEVEIINDEYRLVVSHNLDALEESWRELEARVSSSVFQSYAWCRTWAEACRCTGQGEIPYLVSIWSDNRLVLLWPFVVHRMGPLCVLRSFGEPATRYSDALIEQGSERERWLTVVLDDLRSLSGIDAVVLKGVRDDAAIMPFLVRQKNAIVTRNTIAPFIDFRPAEFDDASQRRSGRTRNALHRHQRNLARYGPVAFAILTDPTERTEAMRRMLGWKEGWLERTAQVSAGYAHPANGQFLQRLAMEPDFVACRLDVGRQTAALAGGILRDGRYWSLVQSYDARYAAHGPGHLLFWHLLQRAKALGIEVLDFLAPATRHKSEWANDEMPVRDYVITITISGRALGVYLRDVQPVVKATRIWARRLAHLFGNKGSLREPYDK